MEWIRLYCDILDDEKISKISDFSYKIFTFLLLLCREREGNGEIDMSIHDLSWRFRLPENKVKKAIIELTEIGILSDKVPITIAKWDSRQYKSDNVSERVKRYREKKETLHETLQNKKCNVIETETETETEKKERKENTPDGSIPSLKTPKPKKTKYADSVWLTDDEHRKLQEAVGQKNLEVGISKLDYSITVKGGKYKDHYKTILNWHQRGFLTTNGNGNCGSPKKPQRLPTPEEELEEFNRTWTPN